MSTVLSLKTVPLVALLDVIHLRVRTPFHSGTPKPLGPCTARIFGGHATCPARHRAPLCDAPNATDDAAAHTVTHADGKQDGDRHCHNGLERMCIDDLPGFWRKGGRNMVPNLVCQNSYATVDALHRCGRYGRHNILRINRWKYRGIGC